jgi:hypothetical protein
MICCFATFSYMCDTIQVILGVFMLGLLCYGP